MQIKGQSNSLRCLSRPSVVASIGLLLINDHLPKPLYPSLITGKLSGFAGLYFFPFVVTLLISLLFDGNGNRTGLIGKVLLLAVGTLFVLIKLTPWFNAAMKQILSGLTAAPAKIVRDPTDFFALSVLVPSWRL